MEVYAHTETYLRTPLQQEYSGSSCSFFEHGQGDYIHILRNGVPMGPLRVLFALPFRRFLANRNINSSWVLPLEIPADFANTAKSLLDLHRSKAIQVLSLPDKPLVLVLLEALDMYHVDEQFWGAYIDHIIEALPDPKRYHFLLKPHPRQSIMSLRFTEQRCRELGISFTMLDGATDKSIAAEILFAQWSERTEHVFCLVSSACFYLSQLYRDPRITYHCSPAFMEKWIGNAPPQFKRLFAEMKPLINEVLSERCLPY